MVTWRSVTITLRRRRLYVLTLLTLCLIMTLVLVMSTSEIGLLKRHIPHFQGNANTIGLVKSPNPKFQGNTNTMELVKSQNPKFQENTNTTGLVLSRLNTNKIGVENRIQRKYSNSDKNQPMTHGARLTHVRPTINRTAHALLYEMTRGRINVTKQRMRNELGSSPDEVEGKEHMMFIAVPPWSEIHKSVDNVAMGGRFEPTKGLAPTRVVFIVPYRNRRMHLKLFLKHMHPFLQRQNLDYVIYVVGMEEDDAPFRKTVLHNAGFLEVMKRENPSCVVFHDIDMLPTNDKNLYHCDERVRHFAVAPQQSGYRLPFHIYIGGALGFPPKYFRVVNGFSNLYEGWGCEDNDMWERIMAYKIPFSRPTLDIGRYDTWSHNRDKSHFNRNRGLLVNATDRMEWDGLNSVKYKVKAFEKRPLFTWILFQTSFQ